MEWDHGVLDTMEAPAFYRQVLRTGIRYGPHFKMLLKKTTNGSTAVLRSDLLHKVQVCWLDLEQSLCMCRHVTVGGIMGY